MTAIADHFGLHYLSVSKIVKSSVRIHNSRPHDLALNDFLTKWQSTDKKQAIIDELTGQGIYPSGESKRSR